MRRYRVRLFFGATLLLALSVVFLWEPVPPMLLALTNGDYFLHSTSSNDFLNNTPPTASTAQFKDSPSVTRTGFKEIGTWYAAPADTAVTLTALQDLHVWLGLKNSDDQGTFFDLRAELWKNTTTLIAAGVTPNIQGVTRNPSQAKEVTVAFGSISDKDKQCAPGDILSLKILVKVAASGGHSNAVGARLYYDAQSQRSRFGATFLAQANTPPVANAGLPQTVAIGTTVHLDGSASHDVDGDALSFQWALTTVPTGSAATLATPAAMHPTFGVDKPGTYVAQLIVNDGTVDSVPATVITANTPPPPPLNAGQITLSEITNGLVTVTGTPGAGVAGTTVTITNTRSGQQATGTVQTNGGFMLQIAAQVGDTLSFVVTDAAGQSSPATTVTVGSALPPDPATVAPSLDRSVATDMATATAFLYTGPAPIQTGVAPGTIVPRRAAVLRGMVLDRSGAPLPGVTIKILNHPEFGQTLSRTDGRFDLAVNGGGPLTVRYDQVGLLAAQRQVDVPWQDYAILPDVILLPLDPQVTPITLGSSAPMQVARGSQVSDADGARQATLFFPQGTQAQMVMPDGSTRPITTLNVRATEFTAGPNGPQAMPADLPPTSAYTYAVVFTADEAKAAGARDVVFPQPLPFYVENFLNSPVGSPVPLGGYDTNTGVWTAAQSGRVIKVVSITNGLAELDTDGDGAADNGTALGITSAERQQLAGLYSPGQSLWRVLIPHFDTGWDANWGWGPPRGSAPPN